jgi:DNA-binding response OmpR family regulator
MPIEPALAQRSVLLGIADTKMAAAFLEIIRAEGIHVEFFSDMNEARTLAAREGLSLVILEHDPPRINGVDMCRAIRRQASDDQHRLPVVMVAGEEDQEPGAAAGVTDWLIKPFTSAYARTKIRAWVLRTACQCMRRQVSADKQRHLVSPRAMQILNTGRDDRFDRITGLYPKPHKGVERRHSSGRATRPDKSALLWMYGRKIASFETPTFSNKVGEIIARATSTAQKRAVGQRRMRLP